MDGYEVNLPFIPGTVVWTLEKKLGHRIPDTVRKRVVNSFNISTDGYVNMQLMDVRAFYSLESEDGYFKDIFWEVDKIGKKVFLSEEEANNQIKKIKTGEVNALKI